MDVVYAGWLSLLPPVLAIVLALITKEVISSLLIGILSGTITYTAMAGLNPLVGPVDTLFDTALASIDIYILLFCFLLGALVHLVTLTGGSSAYGEWASKRLRTKRSSLLATSALGCLIFIDDYFNCLTVGTVMKPVTDRYKVSRAKLAYIIDSTAAPVCIIAPISSWAAAVSSYIRGTGSFESDFMAFCSTIPFNLYALLTLAMVVILSVKDMEFGPMEKAELLARETGDLGAVQTEEPNFPEGKKRGRVADMLVPILSLIVFSILSMLYIGGFWGDDPAFRYQFTTALGNSVAAEALCWGSLAALFVAFLQYVPRRLMTFKEFMEGVSTGMSNMVSAATILVLAWTISGVCGLLETDVYVKDVMVSSNIPGGLLPAIVFVVAAFLSFATGTSWGTFGILIPIIIPVASAISPNLLIVSLAATLGGSVMGDHCSPISDTTILSSTGAGCVHVQHVSTQLPYALLVGGCCMVGYLVAGFTDGNVWLTLLTGFGSLIVMMMILHRRSVQKEALSQKNA